MKLTRGLRKWLGGLTAVGLFAGALVVAVVSMASATGDLSFGMVEGVVLNIDATHRELTLKEDQTGQTASHLQLPGSVDLRAFKVGDHVLVRMGVNNQLILDIQKVS